jgi:hypothetical protein
MANNHIIKAVYYSKPRMFHDASGEVIVGRIGVMYTVGEVTSITGIGQRKIDEIVWNDDLRLFEIRFNKTDKAYRYKGLIVVPYLADTEVYYSIED